MSGKQLWLGLLAALLVLVPGAALAQAPEFADAKQLTSGKVLDYELADLDRDGDVDLLTLDDNHQIAWLDNNGSPQPNFETHHLADGTSDSVHLTVGDLDGDGDLDLVVSENEHGELRRYLNTGGANPRFTAPEVIIQNIRHPSKGKIVDLDQDGDQDIIVNYFHAYTRMTLKERMGGYLDFDQGMWYLENVANQGSYIHHNLPLAAGWPGQIDVTDLDQDHQLDILWADRAFNVGIYHNMANQPENFELSYVYPDVTATRSLGVADFNGDGKPDLLTTSGSYGSASSLEMIALLTNTSEGNPQFALQVIENDKEHYILSPPADLDLDGDPDFVYFALPDGGGKPYKMYFVENKGGEPLAFASHELKELPLGVYYYHVNCVDLDGDGDADIIVSRSQYGPLYWLENRLIDLPNSAGGEWQLYQ